MPEFTPTLGRRVKDPISGLIGRITGILHGLDGAPQALIVPHAADGATFSEHWIPLGRLIDCPGIDGGPLA